MKKLVLVSNAVGNKSVIKDGANGYVCKQAQEYASRIKAAMIDYPCQLAQRAYDDILTIYNMEVMKRKYIEFYNSLCVVQCK